MSNSNIIKNNWNDKFVNLASGLGLSMANCERGATWKEYFVLGYLIAKGLTDDYAEKGYVEKDSCGWLWTDSGLEEQGADVDIALNWLNRTEFIEVIWMKDQGVCYKVSAWVLDKVNARYVSGEPWRMFDE